MGVLRIILIVLMVVLQAVFGIPAYMTDGPYLLRAATYSFFHAGWLHLAVNCLAIWSVFSPRRKGCKPCRDLLLSYLVAVLVYPLSFRPVIGFSNMLYCIMGLRCPPFSHPWWKTANAVTFIVVTLAMAVTPRLAATTHIAAFLCGMFLSYILRSIQNITKDARKYY